MQALSTIACNPSYILDMPGGRPPQTKRCPFGERLFHVREERGLSQREIAARLRIKQQSYAAWERRSTALKPEQLIQLAQILDTTVDVLVGYENGHKRRGGPVGKVRQVFEVVNQLPRHHQQRIVTVVEALVAQSNNGNSQKQAA